MKIEKIEARVVYNNRLEKVIEVEINGKYRGIAPSGASAGSKEVKTLNIERNMKKIQEILNKYVGEEINQEAIDRELKHIKNKIGGNVTTAFSFAIYNALFNIRENATLPFPLSNIIGGGKHNGKMSIQEILIFPKKAKSFKEAFEINRKIYLEIKEKLMKKKEFLGYNDESALITPYDSEKALELVSSYSEVNLGVDFAANSYYNKKGKYYIFEGKKHKEEEYFELIKSTIEKYGLKYIEDPFYEKHHKWFRELKKNIKGFVVGDDLTVTNPELIKKAIKENSISGVIIKPNQIGTITEALEAKQIAEKHNLLPIISHRSGEGDDSTISRMAVNENFPLAKIGIAGIRVVKINELLRLEEKIGNKVINPWKLMK